MGRFGEGSFTPDSGPLPMASPSPLILCCLQNKVQSPQPDLKAFCYLALLISLVSPPLSTNHMILLILLGHSPSFPPPDIASCCFRIQWYTFLSVLPLEIATVLQGQGPGSPPRKVGDFSYLLVPHSPPLALFVALLAILYCGWGHCLNSPGGSHL